MTVSTPPLRPAAQQRACILVVEDTDDIRFFLSTLLQDRYQVISAASGTDGLRLAALAPRPDLILLDVLMPDMEAGCSLAESITPEGIVFLYNPYDIGCYALGYIEVTVTGEELETL